MANIKFITLALTLGLGMTACDSITPGETEYDERHPNYDRSERATVFGDGGFSLWGDSEDRAPENGIGVNSFLWRASIDTISFMPVNSADPFGGVIITDWHANAEAPNERFKLNVYILGRTLRADGIRVAVFRQVLTRAGQWQDAGMPEETKVKIEDAILTRARQLRNTAILQEKN